jgi:tetratricopeptide (TPR) repeat protein
MSRSFNSFIFRGIFLLFIAFYHPIWGQEDVEAKIDTIPEYIKIYNTASALTDSGKYDQAAPLYKKVLKANKDYYMAYNKLAYGNVKEKKYKDCEKNIEKAELIMPMNFESTKVKGMMYFEQNKFKDAKTALDSAVAEAHEKKIEDAELYYYQAQLMYKGKAYKDALGTCITALEWKPKYIEALKLKAESRYALKDYAKAVEELSDAIKAMDEKNMDYNMYKLRAKSKFELKDYKGAIKDWSSILDNDPKNEEAFATRANCKINIGDNSGAIADLDEAIKLNPSNPVSYCNRGLAKSQNKNYVEALKDIDVAIKLKFDYAEAYFRRAGVKMKSKDKHGACDDLAKADSLGDPDANHYFEIYCKIK